MAERKETASTNSLNHSRVGIVVFPGSNCEKDAKMGIENAGGLAKFVWHKDADLSSFNSLILPGGFSYGDYLRTGAMAAISPVIDQVGEFVAEENPVLGICNGFQVLTESRILPGALLKNRNNEFRCEPVYVRTERRDTLFTRELKVGEVLRLSIAHGEGSYYVDNGELDTLEDNGQVLFRYCDENGNITEKANPNGSVHNIAGVLNESLNVLGMMPHPERASEELLGGTDGLKILRSFIT